MELKIALEQTGQSWTLRPGREYLAGSGQHCHIPLSHPEIISSQHLTFNFDASRQVWYARDFNNGKNTLVDGQPIEQYAIVRQTRLALPGSITIVATPLGNSPLTSQYHATSITSTRLLSGSAYRQGMVGAFYLLNRLRSDPYKAKSPEATLDLNEIATHAAQSVLISLICAVVALVLGLIQFLLDISRLASGSFSLSPGIADVFGTIGALVISYELVFLRWSLAIKFLKRNYRPGFRIGFLGSFTNFFKKRILKPELLQNVIIFGDFKPFLGAGKQIPQSEVNIAIDRKPNNYSGKKNEQRIEIPVYEFYKAVDEEIAKLQLPNLEILSKLYVDGFELDVDGNILSSPKSRPQTMLKEDQVWILGQTDLESDRRAYRVYRHIDKARDNVFSFFLRFYNIGSVTFMEISAYGLTSLDRKFFSLKPVLADNTFTRLLKMLLAVSFLSLFKIYLIPALWQLGIFTLNVLTWLLNDTKQSRAVRLQEEYNYGLAETFRESVAAPFDQSYYGNQDLILYWKSLQKATLVGMSSLLQRYGVDTTQFEETATTIVNNGVMVTGGELNANQVAAGQEARTVIGKVQVVASKVGQKAQQFAKQVNPNPKS